MACQRLRHALSAISNQQLLEHLHYCWLPQDTDSCINIQGSLCLHQSMSNLCGQEQ